MPTYIPLRLSSCTTTNQKVTPNRLIVAPPSKKSAIRSKLTDTELQHFNRKFLQLYADGDNLGYTSKSIQVWTQFCKVEQRCSTFADTIRYSLRRLALDGIYVFIKDHHYYLDDEYAVAHGLQCRPKDAEMCSASRWGLYRRVKKGLRVKAFNSIDAGVRFEAEKIRMGEIQKGYTL